MKPAQMGGDRYRPLQTPASVVRATVIRPYQLANGQWRLSVNLRGGRTVRDVRVLSLDGGAMSGERRRLPSKGVVGLIVIAESDASNESYWIGALDSSAHGLDQATADETVTLHPSGAGAALTGDGTLTRRMSNGDLLWAGPGLPYKFELRTPQGGRVEAPTRAGVNHYYLDASRGGVSLGFTLRGGLKIEADAVKRRIELRLDADDGILMQDGVTEIQTRLLQVGPNPEDTVPVALWPDVETTLKALAGELQEVKARVVRNEGRLRQLQIRFELVTTTVLPLIGFGWLLPILKAVPALPLPFITKSGKDGALIGSVGGVRVPDAASRSVYGS